MEEKWNERADARRSFSRRRFLQVSTLGVGASALLIACAPAAPAPGAGPAAPAEGEAPAAAPGEPQTGGTLRMAGHQEVAGLSPDDGGPSVQAVAIRALMNPVIQADEALVSQPILAESVDVSEDGLTYTINLREGVLFHDGTEMTAADVKYTYDFYRDPANATSLGNNFLGVESVDTPDDYTVVVNMDQINAASLVRWAEIPIVPAAYHAEVGEDVFRTQPIGTGAYQLVSFSPAEAVVMSAFEDHFRGRPYIDEVRLEVIPDASVRAIALETGESDVSLWPVLVEDSQRLAADTDNFNVIVTSTGGIKHFMLNNQAPQLSDKLVRQAMLHALDRQRIIDELWNGAAIIAHTNLAPKFAFYSIDQDPNTKRYDFDPDAARALLEEAGWVEGSDGVREKDGLRLSFTCTTISGDTARRAIAELAQQFLADVGVEMQLAEAPLAVIQEGQRNGTTDSSIYNWTYGSLDPDPSATLRSDGGQNWNLYSNPRVDELIDQGVSIVDPEQRRPIYVEIQEIVAEEVPFLYLQWDDWYTPFSSRVQGLPDNANDGFTIFFALLHTWWLDPA